MLLMETEDRKCLNVFKHFAIQYFLIVFKKWIVEARIKFSSNIRPQIRHCLCLQKFVLLPDRQKKSSPVGAHLCLGSE